MRCALILVALAACQFPEPPSGLPCGPDGACADGQVCMDQVCVAESSTCATAVTAGTEHTCAVRSDGTAWCWGRNDHGQLGDRTTVDRTEPVQVSGKTRFAALAAGEQHTCGLADDGSVWCWGRNHLGQISGLIESQEPVPVGLSGVTAIATGDAHSCALFEGGAMKCWGANDAGQLGNNSRTPSRITETVQISSVARIGAGGNATCAVDTSGNLSCWGDNGSGQLGDGGAVRLAPGPVGSSDAPMPGGLAHVAVGGAFMCALTSAGAVHCLGNNTYEQRSGSSTTVPVALPVVADAITAGDSFACVTERRDERHPARVWCWGRDETHQLQDGADQNHGFPLLTSYANIAATAGGGNHLCALSVAGGITCSGDNSRGQLGDGQRTTQGRPPPSIPGLTGVTAIAAGGRHTCATASDRVLCWGDNTEGQIGNGSRSARSTPTVVEGIRGAVAVAAGSGHSCALLADQTVMCWGAGDQGQLGDDAGADRPVPGPVLDGDRPLSGVLQVAAGAAHTCALVAGDIVKCWGLNDKGQCGTAASPSSPLVTVAGLTNVKQITAGTRHTCALGADGMVQCWGGNFYGELGNGGTPPEPFSTTPVVVANLSGVERIASYGVFTCAILGGGSVKCWGNAQSGEIGDGDMNAGSRNPPADPVSNVAGATRIAAGGSHACAFGAGGLACWGAGFHGQTGDGGYDQLHRPMSVAIAGTVQELAAGEEHTCALLDNGTVTCWGSGRAGQLGDGVLDGRTRVAPRLPCP